MTLEPNGDIITAGNAPGGGKTVIRAIRKQKNLSQQQLAEKASITQAYLSLLENGKKTNPSLEVLQQIAEALEVEVSALLSDNGTIGGVA